MREAAIKAMKDAKSMEWFLKYSYNDVAKIHNLLAKACYQTYLDRANDKGGVTFSRLYSEIDYLKNYLKWFKEIKIEAMEIVGQVKREYEKGNLPETTVVLCESEIDKINVEYCKLNAGLVHLFNSFDIINAIKNANIDLSKYTFVTLPDLNYVIDEKYTDNRNA